MRDMPIKVCPNCYHVTPSATRVCKMCGWEFYQKKTLDTDSVPSDNGFTSTQPEKQNDHLIQSK